MFTAVPRLNEPAFEARTKKKCEMPKTIKVRNEKKNCEKPTNEIEVSGAVASSAIKILNSKCAKNDQLRK